MTNEKITNEFFVDEYKKLVHAKSLGFYNCCEELSIFLYKKSSGDVYNIYTIFCFEERYKIKNLKVNILKKLFSITNEYSMGISKKLHSLEEMDKIFKDICESSNGIVDFGEGELHIGQYEKVPKVFVQSDGTEGILLNKILKNNFNNGSYILEFFDVEKNITEVLSVEQLKKMTNEIYKFLPIDLLSLADRIGNIIFQFPSNNVNLSYTKSMDEKYLNYKIEFDKRFKRISNCILLSEVSYDNTIIGFQSCLIKSNPFKNSLFLGNVSELCKSKIIDLKNNLILSMEDAVFIREMRMDMEITTNFSNFRKIYDKNGKLVQKFLIKSIEPIRVKEGIYRAREKFIENRKYKKHMQDLYNYLEFRQYGVKSNSDNAKNDLIKIMNKAAGEKLYLWDPYLTVEDILETVYQINTPVQVLAITSGAIAKKTKVKILDWIKNQKEIISRRSNHYRINLELRCQYGQGGYEFHDRFLMIVKENEIPTVWAIGTSINSLGKKHHIIQKIEQAQLVVDAFEQLWQSLDSENYIVWKVGN